MKVDMLGIPTFDEIQSIYKRRRRINKHHRLLYRKLLDLMGCNKDKDILIDKFVNWCKLQCELDSFDSVMYMIFIKARVHFQNKHIKDIIDYLNKHHYIYYDEIIDYDLYERFYTNEDAIRWIIAYRGTRAYFLSNLRNYYDKSEAPDIDIQIRDS